MGDEHATTPTPEGRVEWLCLALVITLCYVLIPDWVAERVWEDRRAWSWPTLVRNNIYSLLQLFLGLLLALSCPLRSGLRPGNLRRSIRGTLVVCIAPIVVAAVALPRF